MSSILVKYDIDPLNGMTPSEVIKSIKNKLEGRVNSAYYFGSFNTPEFSKYSDIDLLLVAETALSELFRHKKSPEGDCS